MTDDRRRGRVFARIYYEEFIEEFPRIYEDDRLFATWTRLLIGAEKAWPNDPEIPRRVRPATLAYLIEQGVLRVSGYHYHLLGFQKDRRRRADGGKAGATAKWHANASANGHANADANVLLDRGRVRDREGERGARPLDARDPSGHVHPVGRAS